jgi:pyrophosphate--fructose-6-phosphate 1-phosphotransferase
LSFRKEKKVFFPGSFHPVNHFLGYEGRAGFPSPFDANYCYALGMTAAMLVAGKCNGYMSFVEGLHTPVREWSVGAYLSFLLCIWKRGKVR